MSKDFVVLALWMTSAAVCVPFLIMAVAWLRSGHSPYGIDAQPPVQSEVQRRALESLK